MITYMGSKEQYAPTICNYIYRFSSINRWPFWDLCCGSGRISQYYAGPVRMVDAGCWGKFWHIIWKHPAKAFSKDFSSSQDMFNYTLNQYYRAVPEDPVEWAITFFLLQMITFNGRPVDDRHGKWRVAGMPKKNFSIPRWLRGWQQVLALKPRIEYAGRHDIHSLNFKEANVYIDPDYEETKAHYAHGVDIDKFILENPHANIFVSHDKKIDRIKWDSVYDIGKGQHAFGHSSDELLLFKRAMKENYEVIR